MTTNTTKTPAEIVALNHFLSDYPQNLAFSEVLEAIENKADTITIWHPFENFDPEDLTAEIENLKTRIENAITDTNKAA